MVRHCFLDPKVMSSSPLWGKICFLSFFGHLGFKSRWGSPNLELFMAPCCRHFEYAKKFPSAYFITPNRWKLAQVGAKGSKIRKTRLFLKFYRDKIRKFDFFSKIFRPILNFWVVWECTHVKSVKIGFESAQTFKSVWLPILNNVTEGDGGWSNFF